MIMIITLSTPYSHFHFAMWFNTIRLAHVLDSLVRVSRRVGNTHFNNMIQSPELFHRNKRKIAIVSSINIGPMSLMTKL